MRTFPTTITGIILLVQEKTTSSPRNELEFIRIIVEFKFELFDRIGLGPGFRFIFEP